MLLWAVISALSVPPVSARILWQTDTASITVRVYRATTATTGPQQGIRDAVVVVTNKKTGQTRTAVTTETGVAVFDNLAPDTYTVVAKHKDLPENREQSIDVEVAFGSSKYVSFGLQLGLLAALIPPPPSKVTSSTPQQVTSARQDELLEIPNPNRDITPLLQIVPGAISVGPTALGKIIIDGKGKEQQTFKIDGVDATPMVELPSGDPSLGIFESIQKQSVTSISGGAILSGAFDPIYGPGTGFVKDSVTQSGSVLPSLKLYYIPNNVAFNARNFFDYDGDNAIRRTLFGGAFGGTVLPEKAKVFLAYEGIRGRTERNIYEAVPVDALCRCGDGLLGPVLNGYLPDGTTVLDGLSLNSDFLIARRRVRNESESNAFDLRVDITPFADANGAASITSSQEVDKKGDTFTFRFTRQVGEATIPESVTGRAQRQELLFVNGLAKMKMSRGAYDHSLRLGLNQTRGQIHTIVEPSLGLSLTQSLITLSGSVKVTGLPDGSQTVPIATLGGLTKGIGRGYDLNPISFIIGYDGSRNVKDKNHKLSYGVETRFIRLNFDRLGGLTYSFPDVAALREGHPSAVTFLSDLSGPSPFGNGQGLRRARQEYYMGYLQVASKFYDSAAQPETGPRLTLTYGLRYDYFGSVREQNDRAMVIDPQTGEFLPKGTPFYRARKNGLQPRFGVEYALPAKSGFFENTTLRGNVGIYLGVPRIGDLLLPIESDRFSTGSNGGVFPTDPRDVMQEFIDNPLARQFQPLTFADDFTTPERVYKWQASLARTLKDTYEFRIGYSGNVGRNLPLANIGNPIVRVETNSDSNAAALVIRQLDVVRGEDVFKPFGEFFYRTSRGRSAYNAMTLSAKTTKETSLRTGLLLKKLDIQYALSRNVGDVSGTLASDPSNFDSDYGYNASDARHSFTFQGAIYLAPEKLKRGPLGLLWGWTLASAISARSGLPLIIRIDRPDVVYVDASGNVFSQPAAGRRAVINTPGGGATGAARVPDLLPGVNPYLRDGIELLNPAAFAIPKPGEFGNLRRGALRGPGSFQVDFSLARRLFDPEKTYGISPEFKVEFINVFNRANFNNPTVPLPNALPTDSSNIQIQPGVPFTRATAGKFGIITAADPGRQIQFSLTFNLDKNK